LDNNKIGPLQSAPDTIGKPNSVKTIKVRHLISVMLIIFIIAVIAFGILYFQGKRPLENVQPILASSPPKFLYSIYEGKNKLVRPLGVVVDNSGTVYITNNSTHTVEVVSARGDIKNSFGEQGELPGQFLYPYGIGVLPNGNLVIAETGNFRIQILTAKGDHVRQLVTQTNKLGILKPGLICVDSLGNIYIGDLSGSQVLVMDQSGKVLRTIKNISYPHGIAVDERNKKLYISDAGRVNVQIFALDKQDNRPIAIMENFLPDMRFSMVRGLAVDNIGRLYVADTIFNTIRVFDKDGKYLFSFGQQGSGDGEFLYPNQIAVDNLNRIYVTDWGNNRVQVWGY